MCFVFSSHFAQTVTGKWKTIDEKTGEANSIIEIYEKDGKIYGKVIDIINSKVENPLCNCDGDNKDQPILGLVVIEGLTKNDDVYDNGTILNPNNGKIYKCRLKLEADKNTLQVRGYLAFFYRTQYWKRIK